MRILFLFIIFLFPVEAQAFSGSSLKDNQNTLFVPIRKLVAHAQIGGLHLSPDGTRLLMSRRKGIGYEIVIGTVDTDGFKQIFQLDVPADVYSHRAFWADNNRFIVQYTRYQGKLPKRLEEAAVEVFAINFDGTDQLQLWSEKPTPKKRKNSKRRKRKKAVKRVYFQIVHLLPNQPDYILLSRIEETPKKKNSEEKDVVTDIYRFNIRTAAMELATPKYDVRGAKMYAWLPDYNGDIRLGYGEDANEDPVMLIRRNKESKWIRLDNNDLFKDGKFYPLQFGVDDDEFYVTASHATGRSAVYRFNIARGELDGKIFGNSKVSASSINYSFTKGKIVAVNHYDAVFGRTVMDDDFAAMLADIDKATESKGDFYLGSESLDENKMIIWTGDERSPGTAWFYDNLVKKAVKIGPVNPTIDPDVMAATVPVKYDARDGLEIPAYLTLPLNFEEGKPLPAIVMPHGGPHARDYKTWDSWVQFLANRGYVVLQPNFRGSTGFGGRFLALGYGEWGGDMQQDIADGAKWLVRKGYAAPDKMCIVGGSYGGYAALMGIIEDPDRFKCAVSWAPVTDIKLILEQDDAYDKENSWYWQVTAGKKKKELRATSPRYRAKDIKRPLLLMHGKEDEIVYIEQSRLLVKAMKKAKVDYKYMEIDGLGHQLETEAAASLFFREMEAFLAKYNPTRQLTQGPPE
ncbi:MAG: alpha/beta fold hydrolase [Emcibacter sp.]|nr:alpha/beta fold hydrolase [Emcibacter sp.]